VSWNGQNTELVEWTSYSYWSTGEPLLSEIQATNTCMLHGMVVSIC